MERAEILANTQRRAAASGRHAEFPIGRLTTGFSQRKKTNGPAGTPADGSDAFLAFLHEFLNVDVKLVGHGLDPILK